MECVEKRTETILSDNSCQCLSKLYSALTKATIWILFALKSPSIVGIQKLFRSIQCTPHLGTEFPDVNLVDWLKAPKSDEILCELALLTAERGVVFFRAQTQLNVELQEDLIRRLGQLSGRSKENDLYRHPLSQLLGETDPKISVSSETTKRVMCGKATPKNCLLEALKRISGISHINWTRPISRKRACWPSSTALTKIAQALKRTKSFPALETSRKMQASRNFWHTDGIFETNPPDFSSWKLMTLHQNSEDTIWASGYGLYDRLPNMAKLLLESLTATCSQPVLNRLAREKNSAVFEGPRGSPNNIDSTMEAVHPMVRTHPVTGWKSIFTVGTGSMRYGKESELGCMLDVVTINELAPEEGSLVLNKLVSLITSQDDLQVRFQWKSSSDMAIWDNRCTFKLSQPYSEEPRYSSCVVGVGEKPFLDPNSISRAEALAESDCRRLFDSYALTHNLTKACFN